jgi:hypothetical protein
MSWNNKEEIETTCSTVQHAIRYNNMQHGTTMKITNKLSGQMKISIEIQKCNPEYPVTEGHVNMD